MMWITVDKILWTGAAPTLDRLAATPPSGRAAGAAAAEPNIYPHPSSEKNF